MLMRLNSNDMSSRRRLNAHEVFDCAPRGTDARKYGPTRNERIRVDPEQRRSRGASGRATPWLPQPAARLSDSGNRPSAVSVSTESQYSLTSLIIPFSSRNTKQ
jgi:hypothetical protein